MTTFDPKKLSDDVMNVVRVQYDVAYRFDAQDVLLASYDALSSYDGKYDLARLIARNCRGGGSLEPYFNDAEGAGLVRKKMTEAVAFRDGPNVWYFSDFTYDTCIRDELNDASGYAKEFCEKAFALMQNCVTAEERYILSCYARSIKPVVTRLVLNRTDYVKHCINHLSNRAWSDLHTIYDDSWRRAHLYKFDDIKSGFQDLSQRFLDDKSTPVDLQTMICGLGKILLVGFNKEDLEDFSKLKAWPVLSKVFVAHEAFFTLESFARFLLEIGQDSTNPTTAEDTLDLIFISLAKTLPDVFTGDRLKYFI